MTPRTLSYLTKRQKQQGNRLELLMGILAAAQVNYSMCHPTEPACPADFMPSCRNEIDRPLTDEQLANRINTAFMPHATLVQVQEDASH